MKINPKQYASALFESIKDKRKKEVELILKNFVGVLVSNNDIIKFENIIMEFERIWYREKEIVAAQVISAHEISKIEIKRISDYIKRISEAKLVLIEEKQDKSLIGGVVLKYGDKILDGSLRTRLVELKNKMKS